MFKCSFFVKLRNWEYWPWYIVYIPIYFYWLLCGIKARSLWYISAVNPGFEYGGIIGASKSTIFQKTPSKYLPKSILVNSSISHEKILQWLNDSEIDFPLIFKPDIGERGFNVELVKNEQELFNYLQNAKRNIILQEYIKYPLELGIFYYRFPGEECGTISSIVEKDFLKITGDGTSTIRQLMKIEDRARLQIKRLERVSVTDLEIVPDYGKVILLEPIGNHVRGTVFLDGNHLINKALLEIFDNLSHEIEGFFYGRFDLKCKDLDALYNDDFKILEINGAASEPAHIYSPGYSIRLGYKVLFHHWKTLYLISKANHKKGVPYMTMVDAVKAIRKSRFRKA